MGAFQDNAIFHYQLFPEAPIGLNLAWNFPDGTWSSSGNSVFK